jgi:4-hydroxythreonine-4-phosphate dehydrogenase
MKPRIAVSIGDLNGIGIAIALLAHKQITDYCDPLYCIDEQMLKQASDLLDIPCPTDLIAIEDIAETFTIVPGEVSAASGEYSYRSFMRAVNLAKQGDVGAVVTLPIHKEAWSKAGLTYVGHTDLLRSHFDKDAIMMLGCPQMYMALYTEHMPLSKVSESIDEKRLDTFLRRLYAETGAQRVGVLGLNPHAGDNGVLGDDERIIEAAIRSANRCIGKEIFEGPLVPDTAFTPHAITRYNYFVAMYHDQGLIPLKALHFEESINVSLNLPIIRTSVDHGTAFDIAYKELPSLLSYINAVKEAVRLISMRQTGF